MNGKKKKIIVGTSIAFGAVALALGGYGLSFIDRDALYSDADYGDWVVTLAPTCEEKGVETRALLSSPNITQTRDIPALGHDWGEWEEETPPTCITDGVNRRQCSVCYNYDYDPISALGHEWGEWETERAATCLVEGYDKRVCTRDESHIDLRITEATEHDWGAWTIATAPTCTTEGVEQHVCRNDNRHIEQRPVSALGHDWNDPVVTEAPTCTSEGTRTTICRNDKLHTETESIPALGHDWGEWMVTTAPTYFEEGEETRICAHDPSHVEKRVAPILMNGELWYSLNADKASYSVRLRNTKEAIGTVEIPATHEGLPVTKIVTNAFMSCPQLYRVVVLGDNLESIGNNAFANCPMLKEVVITGGRLKEIGNSAFILCTALENFTIPEGVEKVGTYLFRLCTNLKSLSIPASLTELYSTSLRLDSSPLETITVAEGNTAYYSEDNCLIERTTNTLLVGTKNSVIPNGVTAIAEYAFAHREIESIIIPESVTVIGENAFADTAIERIVIPESVTDIQSFAFSNCTALSEIIFERSGEIIIGSYAFNGCTSISRFELPAGAECVYTGAFRNWTEEQTIIVKKFDSEEEADVIWGASWRSSCEATILYETDIEYDYSDGLAFFLNADGTEYGVKILNKNLTGTVTIPATYKELPVTEIPDVAFAKCEAIEKIVVSGNNLKSIGRNAFAYCSALESFEIPEGVTKIGYRAFYECDNLKSISLPASLTDLAQNEFLYCCPALESVTVAEGNEVFRSEGNCLIDRETNILVLGGKNAVIPAGVVGIGKYAFAYREIESLVIPESVTDIGSCAFESCTALTEVVFEGNGLIKIWDYAFYKCTGLLQLELPTSVTEIGYEAFRGCTSIMRLELPAGVTHVGTYAFYGWTEEQTIVIAGFASEEEVDEAWSELWDYSCKATIIYAKEDSE